MASTQRLSGSPCRTKSPHTPAEASHAHQPADVFLTHSTRSKSYPSSPPVKALLLQSPVSNTPHTINQNYIAETVRATDIELASVANSQQSSIRQKVSKRRSQYYENTFASRDTQNTARARVVRDSLIIAEVKLSCKLESEQPFVADLSFQLSEIYQRPASSIMVILYSPIPIFIGGNFVPTYHITITALSLEIAPMMNKRSTALIQDYVFESLNMPLEKGVIRFEAVAEENLATNGTTILQEIEETERKLHDDDDVFRAMSRNRDRVGKKSSVPTFTQLGQTATLGAIPTVSLRRKPGSCGPTASKSAIVGGTTSSKRTKYRKSIMHALFGAPQR